MEAVGEFANTLSGWVWGRPEIFPLMVAVLLLTGLTLTVALRFIQFRELKHSLDVLRGRFDDPEHEGDLSHFQALSTALAATVGIGNIAGVATAIHYGGPGALFWMWVTALLGMAVKYAECTLAMKYRVILPNGQAAGGPMYYIERGLGSKWKPLAIFFAACAIISSFGSGNSIQAFTVADQMRSDLGIPTAITGFITASIVAMVILGGIRRIGRVTSKLVPYMALIYVTGGLTVLFFHLPQLPGVLVEIVGSAFQPAAQIGGFAGGTFIFMLTWGVKRGLFSNESGQGSAPIAHAAAKTDEPVREGVVAMMGPFIDTLIICSITGFVILVTGVWKDRRDDIVPINAQSDITVILERADVHTKGEILDSDRLTGTIRCDDGNVRGASFVRNHSLVVEPFILDGEEEPYTGSLKVEDGTFVFDELDDFQLAGEMAQNGSPLTAWAFDEGLKRFGGNWGHFIVTLGVLLFGISTAISWSYYGDRSTVYLLGEKWVMPYRVVFCVMHFIGAIVSLEIVWNFGDAALGLMAFPNLIALVLLLPVTKAMTAAYFSQKHKPLR